MQKGTKCMHKNAQCGRTAAYAFVQSLAHVQLSLRNRLEPALSPGTQTAPRRCKARGGIFNISTAGSLACGLAGSMGGSSLGAKKQRHWEAGPRRCPAQLLHTPLPA
eukprot:2860582-Pleurochrysis_carterae.AAC.1